jgi:hypothetical protein
VVTKLDWLARSLPDARDILDELTTMVGTSASRDIATIDTSSIGYAH